MVARENNVNVRLANGLKLFSCWDAWLVALGGAVVLLSWVLGNQLLKSIMPGLAAMNPVTALGFILGGASLLCCSWQAGNPLTRSRCGQLLAVLLMLLGAVKLAEHSLGWRISLDQLLFGKLQAVAGGLASPITPISAFNFLLGGMALWCLNSRGKFLFILAQALGGSLALVALVPLVGCLYRALHIASPAYHNPMSVHAAAMFFLLAIGMLVAQGESGIVALLGSRGAGGAVARRFLPVAFVTAISCGGLRIWAENRGWDVSEFGVALMVVGCLAILTGLACWNAVLFNRTDARRRDAELQVRLAQDELELRVQERTAMLDGANRMLRVRMLEIQQTEDKIREQAELLNRARDAIMVLDNDRRIVFWNKGAERLYGWKADQAIGSQADELLFKSSPCPAESYLHVVQHGEWTGELQQTTSNGPTVTIDSRWTLIKNEAGAPKQILLINTNVTGRKLMKDRESCEQRMESIGAVAGGIAHDLNNVLAPIVAASDRLVQNRSNEEIQQLLRTISANARRGNRMVKQVRGFARGGDAQMHIMQIGPLFAELSRIIADTFPESIALEIAQEKNLFPVRGDATDMRQALLNLCANSREAMPHGGQLTIIAKNAILDVDAGVRLKNIPAGDYVLISVSDTGAGIVPEVLPHIFEPFFTTKSADKATGLGLSTVDSVVKQHKGFIRVESESGKGSEFRIYLPAVPARTVDERVNGSAMLPRGNGELILVIDDEESLRELARTTLEGYGYRVITAQNGAQGILRFEGRRDEIALVLTDADMPFMDGPTVTQEIQKLRPGMPIILASDAQRDTSHLKQVDTTNVTTLEKPFTVQELVTRTAKAIETAD
jgi:PAS domain S-box-containing protein